MSTVITPSSNLAIASGIPAIDQCLQSLLDGGVSFTLFSCPFSTPLAFTGNVAVDLAPSAASATFSGRATLGDPFDISVDVVVTAGHTGAWMVELTLPDVQRMTDRVMDKVSDPAAQSVYRKTVRPYLGFYRDAAVAIASEDTQDPAGRTVLGGINFYATFSPFTVPPLDALARTFSHVPLKTMTTTVHLACKKGVGGFAFLIAGEINCDLPFGTSALALTQLALSIDQSITDLTAGATCRFTLRLDKEVLLLRGGFTVDARGEARFSLSLDSADGAWQEPFGIPGVTIGGFGVEVGAGPVFPWIILGARGQALLGSEKQAIADADVGLLLNASSPDQCVVSIHSARGLQLRQLARALLSPSVAALPMLDVAVSDLILDLSPAGGTIAGKAYPAGLHAGGALRLWGFRAAIEGTFDWAGGFALKGAMDPVDLQLGGVRALQITGERGGGAAIAVECMPDRQAASASLRIGLLGAISAATRVDIRDPDHLMISLGAGGDSIYAAAAVRLERERATATGKASFSYPFKAFGTTTSVAMTASVDVTVNAAKPSISEQVHFVAHVGEVTVPLHVSGGVRPLVSAHDASELFQRTLREGSAAAVAFAKRVAELLAESMWHLPVAATAAWLQSVGAQMFTGIMQFSGAAPGSIAQWTTAAFGVSPEQAVAFLGLSADQAIGILVDTFDQPESQARRAYEDFTGTAGDITGDFGRFLGLG